MTATGDLRRLLDESGVEYMVDCGYRDVFWNFGESGTARASAIGTRGLVQMIVTGITPQQAVEATLGPQITGETSDGYHTFNELYHHRAVLFSVIVRDHPEIAWKAKRHHDGTMYEGMFIVGIDTPQGQATYHYDIDLYWDTFECRELDAAPEWDGHTPDDAIARIATLGRGECEDIGTDRFVCSRCGCMLDLEDAASCEPIMWVDGEAACPRFCPSCGRKVK